MMDFPRSRRRIIDLQLTPLIDVAFILIIFFMLTTTFMKVESMEVMLPAASTAPAKKVVDVNMAHLYLYDNGQIAYGQRTVDKPELQKTLLSIFRGYPDQRVVVLVAKGVTLQALVDIMDLVYNSGGKNVFVKELDAEPAPATPEAAATAAPEAAPPIPALAPIAPPKAAP